MQCLRSINTVRKFKRSGSMLKGCIWVQGFTRLPHAGSLKFPSQPYNYVERVCNSTVMLHFLQKFLRGASAACGAKFHLNWTLSHLRQFPNPFAGPFFPLTSC